MKKILISSLLAAAAVGCVSNQKPAMQSSVTDLTPTPAAPAYVAPAPVAMSATPVQPVSYDMAPTTPGYSSTPSNATAISGSTYTVKHGDTLYGIAKKKYGDGKQWTKIASANPGVSPSSLKVGQTITLP